MWFDLPMERSNNNTLNTLNSEPVVQMYMSVVFESNFAFRMGHCFD